MERRRILIVDDREDNANALGSLLRLHGYEVFIETDPLVALSVAAEKRPDAVLLDLGLPRLSGYDVCRCIRAEPWGKEMLIIAITGWTRESDRAEARAAGFDHYLVKPAELETVETLLKGEDRRAPRPPK
ncbi:MAG TPA: response regulator [Gammaproteobacteria bacterium]